MCKKMIEKHVSAILQNRKSSVQHIKNRIAFCTIFSICLYQLLSAQYPKAIIIVGSNIIVFATAHNKSYIFIPFRRFSSFN